VPFGSQTFLKLAINFFTKKMIKGINVFVSGIIALFALIVVVWWINGGRISLVDTQEVSKSFSQFISLEGADEYVVARLTVNEEFTLEKYIFLFKFPVGDTQVKLSLVANYTYYVKLAELRHTVENESVYIHVPKLYLSTPVAFEFSTVRESERQFLFGPDGKALMDQLKQDVSKNLEAKGRAQISVVYDKAAKALADNFDRYFNANGLGGHYRNIMVIFDQEISQSKRQFSYSDGACGKERCSLEFDLGKGLILSIK
jgi:hypothetical protein